jgi:hypothetical protein
LKSRNYTLAKNSNERPGCQEKMSVRTFGRFRF